MIDFDRLFCDEIQPMTDFFKRNIILNIILVTSSSSSLRSPGQIACHLVKSLENMYEATFVVVMNDLALFRWLEEMIEEKR